MFILAPVLLRQLFLEVAVTMASMQKVRPLGTNSSGTDVVVSFCLLIHPELRSSMNNNVQKLVAVFFLVGKRLQL